MKVDVVVAAIREAKRLIKQSGPYVCLWSPINQAVAKRYASHLGGIILFVAMKVSTSGYAHYK